MVSENRSYEAVRLDFSSCFWMEASDIYDSISCGSPNGQWHLVCYLVVVKLIIFVCGLRLRVGIS